MLTAPRHKTASLQLLRCVRVFTTLVATLAAARAQADLKNILPPQQPPGLVLQARAPESPSQQGMEHSVWHFQATHGISTADVESPALDLNSETKDQTQQSTTGVFNENRFGHSFEIPMTYRQALRIGVALINSRSVATSGWLTSLTGKSKAPDWRTWGVGTDVFLVRHTTGILDLDAGLQADYFVSGVTTLSPSNAASNQLQNNARLEQKYGWRVAFTGGIGGLYIGPLGLILRLSGQVLHAQFKDHAFPLRAQGLQLQLGAGLALGRGEP